MTPKQFLKTKGIQSNHAVMGWIEDEGRWHKVADLLSEYVKHYKDKK